MKRITLSLAVVAMMVTAAQADIKNESFGGSASLFYGTNDAGNGDFFSKGPAGSDPFADKGSYGNVAVSLAGSANVGSCDTCTKLNYGVTGVSTMGLASTLVNGTWVNQNADEAIWLDTLNLTFTPFDGVSNTTMVAGRQALATPMVFTETWNIAKNTYDAAVAVNTDITDTTLVGAWVGRSNVAGGSTVNAANFGDGYSSFLTPEGAYAFGAVTKLIPTVDAQAWYYVAPSTANVAWLQADTEIAGISLGAQYGMLDGADNSDGNAVAVKVGYAFGDVGLSAAYSTVDEMTGTSGTLGFVNLGGAQTPLYTAGWWNVGGQGASNTDSYNVTAEYQDFGLYVTSWETGSDATMEAALTYGMSVGSLDMSFAYIYTDADTNPDTVSDLQAYLTYNF